MVVAAMPRGARNDCNADVACGRAAIVGYIQIGTPPSK
jgi:hypothetical protein